MTRTNIEIDEALIKEAKALSKLTTKKAIINEALKQYVAHLRRMQMLKLRGQVVWGGDLDDKRTADERKFIENLRLD